MPTLLPLVIKYATKLGRIHLAEKLGELLPQFEEQEREREKYDENEAANELLLSTPTLNGNLIQSNLEKNSTPSIVPVNTLYLFYTKRERERDGTIHWTNHFQLFSR